MRVRILVNHTVSGWLSVRGTLSLQPADEGSGKLWKVVDVVCMLLLLRPGQLVGGGGGRLESGIGMQFVPHS